MTAQSERAAAIAAKLTDAQRDAILDAQLRTGGSFWVLRPHLRAIKALHQKQLADDPYAPSRLTNLGVAVRDHVKDSNNAK